MDNSFILIIILGGFAIVIALLLLVVFIIKLFYKVPDRPPIFKGSNSKFDELYQKLYDTHINRLENLRKKTKLYTVICIILLLSIMLLGELLNLNLMIILFILMILLATRGTKYHAEYNKTFKQEIISNFIKLLNPMLNYSPTIGDKSLFYKEYINANFDNSIFNRFYADDYLEGDLDNSVSLNLADLNIQHTTGSGKNRQTVTLFQGIFAYTECQKDIGTYVKISKNATILSNKQNNRVEMDNSEFEKYFDIYSEDNILATRLLTSDTMQTLLDFYNKFKIQFEIVFKNNSIYLRFFTGSMFEPNISGNSLDKSTLYQYYSILEFILDITKIINLTLQDFEV